MIKTLLLALFAMSAQAAQLSYIGAAPNSELEFVSSMLDRTVEFNDPRNDRYPTEIFSILHNNKIDSVAMIVGSFHQLTIPDTRDLLSEAAVYAPVVLTNITPRDGSVCLQMKKLKDTLFVLPAGDRSLDLNIPGIGVKWCDAPNMLFVGSLKSNMSLAPFSNFGTDYVRVAAPGINLRVLNKDGYSRVFSGSLASAAIVAAKVAQFAEKFPRLKGLYLAHRYLESRAKSSKKLATKVKRGKIALLR
jgi:subtilisin family serine protease